MIVDNSYNHNHHHVARCGRRSGAFVSLSVCPFVYVSVYIHDVCVRV